MRMEIYSSASKLCVRSLLRMWVSCPPPCIFGTTLNFDHRLIASLSKVWSSVKPRYRRTGSWRLTQGVSHARCLGPPHRTLPLACLPYGLTQRPENLRLLRVTPLLTPARWWPPIYRISCIAMRQNSWVVPRFRRSLITSAAARPSCSKI